MCRLFKIRQEAVSAYPQFYTDSIAVYKINSDSAIFVGDDLTADGGVRAVGQQNLSRFPPVLCKKLDVNVVRFRII